MSACIHITNENTVQRRMPALLDTLVDPKDWEWFCEQVDRSLEMDYNNAWWSALYLLLASCFFIIVLCGIFLDVEVDDSIMIVVVMSVSIVVSFGALMACNAFCFEDASRRKGPGDILQEACETMSDNIQNVTFHPVLKERTFFGLGGGHLIRPRFIHHLQVSVSIAALLRKRAPPTNTGPRIVYSHHEEDNEVDGLLGSVRDVDMA